MNTPLNSQGSFAENKLTQQLKTERSMQSRLILWLQLYPFSISGLKLENLINDQKKKFQALLEPAIKKTLTDPKNEPTPKEIKIDRNILNKISEHTGVSRRSLERGISSFFARKFSLFNIYPYSRKFLIFGTNSQIVTKKKLKIYKNRKNDNTVCLNKRIDQREDRDNETQKEKVHKKELTQENGLQNRNENENATGKEKDQDQNQIKQTNYQQVEETLIMNLVRQKRSLNTFNHNGNQSIISTNNNTNHNNTNLNINQNNNNTNTHQTIRIPDQQTLKTPLQILCEVSQLYKKRRLNTTQYGLHKKTNLYSKKN
ncbi:hypothetical protein M0813_04216 [Anaeramoeba flamelloides]|uniref:Uncharacterized protein n=1 Tax=Anaeramoeba flamelloides TaxID=1746091 RepID=A0ABQ8XL68_9EUKA|nr:hypothetical protein M0813_04216 [Anaeramoeba flamelloides]